MRSFVEHIVETINTSHFKTLTLPEFLFEWAVETLDEAYAPFLGATVQPFPHADLQSYLGRVQSQTKAKGEKYKLPYIHRSNIKDMISIKDEHGVEFDLDKLRALVKQRPKYLLKQNEKMQHSDGTATQFFNIGLPALKGLAVNEKTGEFVIVDTCPGAGACKLICYAMKGGYVQYPASSLGQTRVLNFLVNDPDGFEAMLSKEVAAAEKSKGKKGVKIAVRWHDAGDFFSPDYMQLAYSVARKFPNVDFYAYTKMADVAHSVKPENFIINFSGGAKPNQERQIDFARTKHSKVVAKELFSDLIVRHTVTNAKGEEETRLQFKSKDATEEFKRRMAQKYVLPIDTILSYEEMMHTPKGNSPHWNVYVIPGDGDDSANRRDVIGTYLLIH